MTALGPRGGAPPPRPYSGPMPRRRPLTHRAVAVAALTAVLVTSTSTCGIDRQPTVRLESDARPPAAGPGRGPELVPDHDADLHPAGSPGGLPAGWRPAPLRWEPCGERAGGDRSMTCASLAVPLDWSRPEGETIELAVARRPADGPAEDRVGTIVANPGGPGGSGVELIAADPFDGQLAHRFDRVGWDPRGVGDSTPVTCGTDTVTAFVAADPDPDTPAEQAELERRARAVSDDCAARDAALLAHIGTRDVVRDLEALRLALGGERIDYVGFSYGTQIGQLYAEMFPSGVRTMVLDGVVDPSKGFTDFLMGQIDGFDDAFAAAALRCSRAGDDCPVDDLAAAYDRVRERVELTPLPASGRTPAGPAELATAAIYSGYVEDGWRALARALSAALDGDGSRLVALADDYHDLGGYGAYAGVVCTDTPPPASTAAWQEFSDLARARSPRFGGSVANELLPCATWPVRSDVLPAPVTAPDAPPIMVVGNTGDPATPLEGARAVAATLASAVLVTVDIGGHTAYGRNRCATELIDAYVVSGTAPGTDRACRPD